MKTKIIVTLLVILYLGATVWAAFCQKPVTPAENDLTENTDSCISKPKDTLDFQLHLLMTEAPQLRAKRAVMDTLARKTPTRYGETSLTGEGLDPSIYLRSDRISQFILRFNGDSTAMAALSDKFDFTAQGSQSLRKGHILSLVNAADVLHDQMLTAFADDVCHNRLFIDEQQESNCLAVTTMGFKDIWGKLFPVRILLRQSDADGAPVWYIKGVESPYFTYGISNAPYYIDLVEREFDFMELSRHTERSAASLAGPDFRADNLSTFLFLYHKGFIKYDHAETTLFFFTLGDYTFRVEEVESFEHKRSGYLITRIVKDGRVIFENRPVE